MLVINANDGYMINTIKILQDLNLILLDISYTLFRKLKEELINKECSVKKICKKFDN